MLNLHENSAHKCLNVNKCYHFNIMSSIYARYECFNQEKCFVFHHFSVHEQLKCHAQVGHKKDYNCFVNHSDRKNIIYSSSLFLAEYSANLPFRKPHLVQLFVYWYRLLIVFMTFANSLDPDQVRLSY